MTIHSGNIPGFGASGAASKELDHNKGMHDEEEDDDFRGDSISRANTNTGIDQSQVHGNSEKSTIEVATQEGRAVWYLRLLVVSLLSAVALAICLSVFFFTQHSEKVDMEEDFADLSEKLVATFELTFQQRFGIIDSFAKDLTSYQKDTPNVKWPMVTMPDFERRAGRMARLADLLCVLILPRVETEEREAWESYAVENQGWRGEGLALQQGISVQDVEVDPIQLKMFKVAPNGTEPEDRPGPYYPIWQTYPAVNFNRHTHLNLYRWQPLYTNSIDAVVETKKPVLPTSYDYWGTPKDDLRRTVFNKYVNSYERYSSQRYEDDPVISVFVPVFDRLEEDEEREVAAIVLGAIYWRTYLNGILPPGANGIIVVLENRCDQQYTYQVDGEESTFLGHGDLHDTKYDYLMTEAQLTLDEELFRYSRTEEQVQEEVNLKADCRYSLRVYPSKDFDDAHTSNKPLIYTLSLAAVFIFTSAVFLLYDYCVERRQKVVLRSAQQSGAIVQSLFPEAVRDRMYEEQEGKRNSQVGKDVWKINGDGDDAVDGNNGAIAHLYPDCTVSFADLAGFTQWSASRTPVQVFDLLETIYAEFDKIARRRRVFKVETIGDCYVATTGLPNAQKDHAVIMAKFANDCMRSLTELKHELVDSLGDDTANLTMRFGLHSGPVTAGVLRGDKGRFQLFGDTVNTAARMESNGLEGKIQVSEYTAQLLRDAGRESWLTARDELVQAKGKGSMQTYWVEVLSLGAATETKSTMSADPVARTLSLTPSSSEGQEEPAIDIEGKIEC